MSTPGIVTTGRENKVVQQFTAATAPRAAEYGSGSAVVDGVTYTSDGVSNDSFPSGWSSKAFSEPCAKLAVPYNLGLRTVVFGDSILARGGAFDSFENVGNQNDNGYVHWHNGYAGQPFNIVRNAARSGSFVASGFTLSLLDRVAADVLPYAPDVVLLNGGINDVLSPRPVETVAADIIKLINIITGQGIRVIYYSITLLGSPNVTAATALNAAILEVNHIVKVAVNSNSICRFVDITTGMVDTTLAYLAGRSALYTDGLHPGPYGARILGLAAANACSDITNPFRRYLPFCSTAHNEANKITLTSVVVSSGVATATLAGHNHAVGDWIYIKGATPAALNQWQRIASVPSTSTFTFQTSAADGTATGTITASKSPYLTSNATFATTTGGTVTAPATGTAPANCSVSRLGAATVASTTAARTVNADGDAYGNNLVVTITPTAADDGASILMNPAEKGFTLDGNTWIVAEGMISVTDTTVLKKLELYISFRADGVDGNASILKFSNLSPNNNAGAGAITNFTFSSVPKLLPAGTTINWCYIGIDITCTGVGSAFDVKLGRVGWRRINV